MKIGFLTTNGNFCGSILEEMRAHHSVREYKESKDHALDLLNMKGICDWADLLFFDFIQHPLPMVSNFAWLDKPIVARMDGIDILNHTAVNWQKVNALVLMPVQRKRLLRLRSLWHTDHPGRKLMPLPKTILELNVGIDLDLFKFSPKQPSYRIVLHSTTVRPTKRVYTGLQCFYDLINEDPDKPWELYLVGNYMSPNEDEYCMSVSELIEDLDFPESRLKIITQDFPREKWAEFIRDMDVYWCNSYREGFPNSCGEACSSGVYPIVNHFYGAELIYPGYTVKSPKELVKKTIAWGNLTDEAKIAASADARNHISKWSRQDTAVKIRQLCEQVLEKEKR